VPTGLALNGFWLALAIGAAAHPAIADPYIGYVT
jgi:hypothetical protein